MTNEEFWAKPANAVYTTPAISKTGIVIGLVIIGLIIRGIHRKITTSHSEYAVDRQCERVR